MKKIFKKMQTNRGFTLLFAVVVSIIVLSIGLVLSVIAVKEFTISGTFRDSMLAFYAAESGTECARYWATKQDTSYFSSSNPSIKCNGDTITPTIDPNNSSKYIFSYKPGGVYKADVTVTRKAGLRDEDIEAEGYNTTQTLSNRIVERYQLGNVSGLCSLKPDFMILADNSASISNAGAGQIVRDAITDLINSLNPGPSFVHIGQVIFGTNGSNFKATLSDHLSSMKNFGPISSMGFNSNTDTAGAIFLARKELTGDLPGSDPRPSSISGKYMVVITDGASNSQMDPNVDPNNNPNNINPYMGCDNDASCIGQDPLSPNPNTGSSHALQITESEANVAKSDGIEIIAVGIGAKNQYCEGYASCADWFRDHIASSPDLYYETTFADLANTLSKIRFCYTPIIQK